MQADRILIHWLDREMCHYARVEERLHADEFGFRLSRRRLFSRS